VPIIAIIAVDDVRWLEQSSAHATITTIACHGGVDAVEGG
jgi:hypothetical protein